MKIYLLLCVHVGIIKYCYLNSLGFFVCLISYVICQCCSKITKFYVTTYVTQNLIDFLENSQLELTFCIILLLHILTNEAYSLTYLRTSVLFRI